jgi:hypothetical protein
MDFNEAPKTVQAPDGLTKTAISTAVPKAVTESNSTAAPTAPTQLLEDVEVGGYRVALNDVLLRRLKDAPNSDKWVLETHPPTKYSTSDIATQQKNLQFFKTYVPPALSAPNGITLAQLHELRGKLTALIALCEPSLLPDQEVSTARAAISNLNGRQIADYVDHLAFSAWRVQEDVGSGSLKYGSRAKLRALDGSRRFARWESVHYRVVMSPSGALGVVVIPSPAVVLGRETATLYTLRLEKRRWYVGHTTRGVETRVEEHRRNFRSRKTSNPLGVWTQKYRVEAVANTQQVPLASVKDAENAEVARMAQLHGMDSVRGGDYTSEYLDPKERTKLQKIFKSSGRRYLSRPRTEMVVQEASSEMVALQRFVTELRRRTTSHGVTQKEYDALLTSFETKTPASKYLGANGLRRMSFRKGKVLTTEGKTYWERKPLPEANRIAFENVVTNSLGDIFLAITAERNTGEELLILAPEETHESLLSTLLNMEGSQMSSFVGLSANQLYRNLSCFFYCIPQKLVYYFENNTEVTQLHKRVRKIAQPRTVTGLYAGHRFGMDTTFLVAGVAADKADGKNNMNMEAQLDVKGSKKGKGFTGSAKWWPRHKEGNSTTLAKDSSAWFDNYLTDYIELVETGECVRQICQKQHDEGAVVSPFPCVVVDKPNLRTKLFNRPSVASRLSFHVSNMETTTIYSGTQPQGQPPVKNQTKRNETKKAKSPTLLATVIDMYSRKAWVYPAAAAGAHHLYSALALRFAIADGNLEAAPPIISTDNGTEFHTQRYKEDGAEANENETTLAMGGIFHVRGVRQQPERKHGLPPFGFSGSEKTAQTQIKKHLGTVSEVMKTRIQFEKGELKLMGLTEYIESEHRKKLSRDARTNTKASEAEKLTYKSQLVTLKKQTTLLKNKSDIQKNKKHVHWKLKNPFVVYAGAMGSEVITTTVPMFKQSGAHGPIESFHRTFKLMLAKETALFSSAAAKKKRNGNAREQQDTWCMPTNGDASSDPGLWCVTTTLIMRTLVKYNNTVHGSTGVTPNQLYTASREVRKSADTVGALTKETGKSLERAHRIVSRAEETMVRAKGKQRKPAPPIEVGTYVRILLTAPDRRMNKANRDLQNAAMPTFRKGYDWNWTSRLYEVTARKAVDGSKALKGYGVPEYQFYVYTVSCLKNPANRASRITEPQFSDNLRLTAENLMPLDRRFLKAHPEHARLFLDNQEKQAWKRIAVSKKLGKSKKKKPAVAVTTGTDYHNENVNDIFNLNSSQTIKVEKPEGVNPFTDIGDLDGGDWDPSDQMWDNTLFDVVPRSNQDAANNAPSYRDSGRTVRTA